MAGVDLLWWTDHDYMYYPRHFLESGGFNFEEGAMEERREYWPSDFSHVVHWDQTRRGLPNAAGRVQQDAARSGSYGLRLRGTGRESSYATSLGYEVDDERFTNYLSLLGDVHLGFSFYPHIDGDASELEVRVRLSMTGSSSNTNHGANRQFIFFHSATDYAPDSDPTRAYIELEGQAGEWTDVQFDLSRLAQIHFPDVGLDAHAELVEVRVNAWGGERVTYDVDDFWWRQQLVGEDLRQAQLEHLESLTFRPRHLVGQEITLVPGAHIGAYGSDVPFLPYWQRDDWTLAEAVEVVHNNDGVAAYAHMFGVSRNNASDETRATLVVETLEELLLSEVYGCDMLEVGYRERLGLLEDFVKVWDGLLRSGVYVTGIGASDVHNQVNWLGFLNNFVTWIESASMEEEDIKWALQRGSAWFGDPAAFPGARVDLWFAAPSHQAVQGQVVQETADGAQLDIQADPLQRGWEVRLIRNDDLAENWPVLASGRFAACYADLLGGDAVYRVEVYDDDDVAVLFSNPIVFSSTWKPAPRTMSRQPRP